MRDNSGKPSKDSRICPICGQDNGCKHSKDCWCYDVKIPQELLDTLPHDKKEAACICKSCIDKYNNALQNDLHSLR